MQNSEDSLAISNPSEHESKSSDVSENDKSNQWPGTESMNLEEKSRALLMMKSTRCTEKEGIVGKVEESGAGSWGELEGFCDSPLQTALSILEHINERFSRHIHSSEPDLNDGRKIKRRAKSSSHDHKIGIGRNRERKVPADDDVERTTMNGINSHDRMNDNEDSTMNTATSEGLYQDHDEYDERMNENDSRFSDSEDHHDHDNVIGSLKHDRDSNDTIDYILWTGDITPHDVWNSNMGDLIRVVRTWSQAMKSNLPKGVPVFPIMGNHDTIPVNQ